ncbi:hypothetical protein ACFV2X_26340 [Streptomyces sp. NPDC059679]|uniref:hypothetical protein n=1 Tax=Streptomyces sp. NPDC059679 TaxID=3346903 RepID=UPI0036798672
MRKACELVGGFLLFQGLIGIAHELIGWFRLMAMIRFLPFLDGYELYASIGLTVVGFLVVAVAEDSGKSPSGSPSGPLISDADRARPE